MVQRVVCISRGPLSSLSFGLLISRFLCSIDFFSSNKESKLFKISFGSSFDMFFSVWYFLSSFFEFWLSKTDGRYTISIFFLPFFFLIIEFDYVIILTRLILFGLSMQKFGDQRTIVSVDVLSLNDIIFIFISIRLIVRYVIFENDNWNRDVSSIDFERNAFLKRNRKYEWLFDVTKRISVKMFLEYILHKENSSLVRISCLRVRHVIRITI